MHYRPLGKTGLSVSEMSYGASRGADTDPEQFIATVQAALDGGVNFFDTASHYGEGQAEVVLGKALKGRDDVYVETKYLPYDSFAPEANYTGSPADLRASVERSLSRLDRGHIDVLLGHGMRTMASYDRFMEDGTYEAMVKLRDEGKVRFIGISELSENDGEHAVLQKAVPTGAFDVVMLTINFMLQTAIDSVLPLCKEHGVGTVVMMPLNQAWQGSGLVGPDEAAECVRRHIAHGNLPDAPPYTDKNLLTFLKPYTIPEAALRYVLSQEVSSCCFGARSPQRVTQNLVASSRPYLDNARLLRLKELFGRIKWQVR